MNQCNNSSKGLLSELEPAPTPWLAAYSQEPEALRAGENLEYDRLRNYVGKKVLGLVGAPGSARIVFDTELGVTVIFDGHLFNRKELLEKLRITNFSLSTNAEIILKGYIKFEEEIGNLIRGNFVFLLADISKDKLLCKRDRMGSYTLFYTETPNEMYFSTSIDFLLTHAKASREINRAALADHLNSQKPFIQETFYSGIHRIPPGHTMQVIANRKEVSRDWFPIQPGCEIHWLGEDEVEEFPLILKRSISPYLNFGHTGIHLTGGIDSSTVTTIASDLCVERGINKPVALSLIFPNPAIDEGRFQRGVVNTLGLEQICIPVEETILSNGYLWSSIQANSKRSIPTFDIWTPAIQHLEQEAMRQGVNTVLTGSGGDSLFLVNPIYGVDLIKSLDIIGLINLMVSNKITHNVNNSRLLKDQLWNFGLRPLLLDGIESLFGYINPELIFKRRMNNRINRIPSWLAPNPSLKQDLVNRIRKSMNKQQHEIARAGYYIDSLQSRIYSHRLGMLREERFETALLEGINKFSPLINDEIIEYLVRVPPDKLNLNRRSKGLARHMLESRYQGLGFDKQKKNHYSIYRRQILEQGVEPAWRRLGGAPTLTNLGIVDMDKLEEFAQRSIASRNFKGMNQLAKIMQAELWTKRH